MKNLRRGMVLGLVLLTLAVVTPLAVRWATAPAGPSLWIELPNGVEKRVGLADLRRLAQISRRGEVQNQFGNWRDGGTYTGALLADVLRGIPYASIDVVAADGYRMAVDRARVESEEYPMVVAYALDGLLVPTWVDGFRIVVLPDHGRVSNEDYGVLSAGSFWVKNVVRIVPLPAATTGSEDEPSGASSDSSAGTPP